MDGELAVEPALALTYALSRPVLKHAATLDPAVLPSALLVAAALWRFESAARKWLREGGGAELLPASTPLRLLCTSLQLLGLTSLWLCSEWAVQLGRHHLLPLAASITRQSVFGLVAAFVTALAFSSRGGSAARLLRLLGSQLISALQRRLGVSHPDPPTAACTSSPPQSASHHTAPLAFSSPAKRSPEAHAEPFERKRAGFVALGERLGRIGGLRNLQRNVQRQASRLSKTAAHIPTPAYIPIPAYIPTSAGAHPPLCVSA